MTTALKRTIDDRQVMMRHIEAARGSAENAHAAANEGEDADAVTELRALVGFGELALEHFGEKLMKDGATKALDAIAELCGCAEWEYPNQVVRDVQNALAGQAKHPAAPVRMNRAQCFAAATQAIADRSGYADPEQAFARVAELWTVLLGREVKAHEVALCLAALKLARLAHDPAHLDSWVDLAGYAACGVEVATGGLF